MTLLCPMHLPGLFFVCVSFLNLWCPEKGSNLAVLKTKNFKSPEEQLLRYQEPMVRLLCSTCCPRVTPGDSLLICGSRNSQQMCREQGKRAKKWRVMRDNKQWGALRGLTTIWEGRVSDRCEALKKNREVQVVGTNSSLWETVSLLSRASR